MILLIPLTLGMLKELLKEEEAALKDFELFIKTEPKIEETEAVYDSNIKEILENLVKKSELALKECQLIESLDKQLRLISDTQSTLSNLKKLNQLNDLILSSENDDLSKLVPLALEWRNSADCSVLNLSESSETVKTLIDEKLPKKINEEIEKVLLSWTDDIETRDQQSIQVLSLRLDSANPLHCLFASYPLSKLTPLLEYHRVLGNSIGQFSDRLLNRFYDILASGKTAPFSVGQIEVLISEKMKFATRISCILEATFNFIKLHPDLKEVFMEKCGQICRQIRKCAKEERSYDSVENKNAAILDSQLNEISLIATTLMTYGSLVNESKKWIEIYLRLEEIYLVKGIQQAIEIDQITTTEEFPVSSCVDDIFYVLKAAKGRIDKIQPDSALIPNSLREYFLSVLKKYLDTSIQSLKPLNLVELKNLSPFRPSLATKVNWRRVKTPEDQVDQVEKDIKSILVSALNNGIYSKVLQSSVKKELSTGDSEELFIKTHSLLTIINNLFKTTMAKEALDELISLTLSDFSQLFCKQLFDDQIDSTLILRYDRLLHELTNYLEETLAYRVVSDPSLLRLKQSISLLLAEDKNEAQELVEEWKKENECSLRAGEILLIMNKL